MLQIFRKSVFETRVPGVCFSAGGGWFPVPVFYFSVDGTVSGSVATFVRPVREAEQGELRSAGERTDRAGTAAISPCRERRRNF